MMKTKSSAAASAINGTREEYIGSLHMKQGGVLAPCEGVRLNGYRERKSGSSKAQGNLRRRIDQPSGKFTPASYELIEQVNDKALAIIGDGLLNKEQLEARPKCAAVGSKVVKVLGSSRVASDQLRRRLGEEISQEQARALKYEAICKEQLEKIERERELQQILELESPEGDPITHQIHVKAAALMGDNELDKQQLSAIPKGAKVDHKEVTILGESKLLLSDKSSRALKRLGSEIEPEQVAEMIRAERRFAALKKKQENQQHRERIEMVLNTKPERRATEVLDLWELSINQNKKAIFQMGDDYLEKRALGFCPSNRRGNKKATFILGTTEVAAKKAQRILE